MEMKETHAYRSCYRSSDDSSDIVILFQNIKRKRVLLSSYHRVHSSPAINLL